MNIIKGAIIALTLSGLNTETSLAADYPPNIDYGQQGDFITKRAVEHGRAAINMTIGPVLISQPEGPGSSQEGLGDEYNVVNQYWDLTDLTNPQSFEMTHCETHEDGCFNTSPVQAHATVVRLIDGEPLLWEPTWRTGRWTGFDPSGATSAEQMTKTKHSNADRTIHGSVGHYGSLTSPYNLDIYWGYGDPPTEDYYIADPRTADGSEESGGGNFTGYPFVEWDHLGLTGVSGFPIWMGNLLIYASDQLQTGIAIYDTTGYKEGNVPELLSFFNPAINKPEPNNGITERIGGYWFEPYGNDRVIFAARKVSAPVQREFSSMFIVNYADPSNPFISCELYFNQTDSRDDGDITSNPQYVHFQDGYAFVDHFRVDIAACEAAYADDQRVVQSDDPAVDEFYDVVYRYQDIDHSCDGSQYYRPLGQVGVFGGYNDSNTKWTIDYTGTELPNTGERIRVYRNGVEIGNGDVFGYRENDDSSYKALSFNKSAIAGDQINTASSPELRNVLFGGTNEHMNEQGLCFVVMYDEPDTTAPFVSGHAPVDGATNIPIDTFIHIHIPETLRTETLVDAMVVRNNSTNEIVSSRQQLSHTGMLSIWPDEDLDINTTYTVSVSGIQDFMGNTMTPLSFNFSTGGNIVITEPPVVVDEPAPTIGTPDFPGTPYFPNQSGQLSCLNESLSNNLWAVNPDNHTITVANTSIDSSFEAQIGNVQELFGNYRTPTSITHIDTHYAVTFRDDDQVVFFNATTTEPEFSFNTGYGSQPISSVVDDDNNFLYVALYGSGSVIKLDVSNRSQKLVSQVGNPLELKPGELGATPKAMALHNDQLLVTRYISARTHGEVYDIDVSNMSLTNTITVNKVTVSDDIDHGSGIPNFLSSIVVTADGTRAYISASKANTDNAALDDDNTVRPMMAILNLSTGLDLNEGDTGNKDKTIDFDNAADPSSVVILPDGNTMITAFQGNNKVFVQKLDSSATATFFATEGGAPQSLCTTERITYVKNYTDRTISVMDTSKYMYDGTLNADVQTLDTIIGDNTELLTDQELLGLQTFYHSSLPEMGPEGYMSCATCHQDGGQDGQVWNLVGLGEGLRNTLSLNGTSGTRFGNLHWSQNFDEVQDFEVQMENLNKGDGLIPNETFIGADTPLNETTSNRSDTLDALAAYVESLGKSTVKRSPYRDTVTGELSLGAQSGQDIFNTLGCVDCHSGAAFRDGLAHDVGTIDPSDNQAYGQAGALTQVRTPTLIDLFETAPYLHNGSAATLEEVFDAGGEHAVPEADRAELIEFLYSIDIDMFIEDDATFTPSS